MGDAFAIGEWVGLDYNRAVEAYTKGCGLADGESCRALGDLYVMGALGTIDGSTAGLWYQAGCGHGDAGSCTAVGLWMERGDGGADGAADARALFEQACSMGHARGCTQLGIRLKLGDGVRRDHAAAAEQFRRGCRAETWDPEACREWGTYNVDGKVVPLNEEQGRLDIERACYAGDHLGCRLLSDHLKRSNLAEAVIASERGCSLGDPPSCTRAERLRYRLSLQKQ